MQSEVKQHAGGLREWVRFVGPWRIAVGVVVSLGLLWLVARGLEARLVGEALTQINPGWVVLALGIFLLGNLVRAWRWGLLFMGKSPGVRRLFLVQNAGLGLNNLVPVRVVSEATQFALLTLRDRVEGGLALATLGMERVLDLVVSTLLILLLVLALVPGLDHLVPYLGGAVILSLASVVLVLVISRLGHRVAFIRRVPLLASFAQSIALMERARLRTGVSAAGTLAYWLIIGLTGWVVAYGLDTGLSFPEATLVVLGGIFFATSLPSIPGAVGTFEAALVYMLKFLDVEGEVALAFAIIMHLLLFVPPIVLAAVILPREGVGSLARVQEWPRRFRGNRGTEEEAVPPTPDGEV